MRKRHIFTAIAVSLLVGVAGLGYSFVGASPTATPVIDRPAAELAPIVLRNPSGAEPLTLMVVRLFCEPRIGKHFKPVEIKQHGGVCNPRHGQLRGAR